MAASQELQNADTRNGPTPSLAQLIGTREMVRPAPLAPFGDRFCQTEAARCIPSWLRGPVVPPPRHRHLLRPGFAADKGPSIAISRNALAAMTAPATGSPHRTLLRWQ